MANREEIVTDEYVEPSASSTVAEEPASTYVQPGPRVVEEPTTYVEPSTRVYDEPSQTYVRRRDPVATTWAASTLITTLVWSAVVIVLLVVGILVLVRYHII